jgi:hypothetical protein
MAETRFGTFEELMTQSEVSMRPIATRLRELVLEVDPDAVEVVRLGDRAATYGLGPRKMSEGYCYVLPYTKWVNLGFFQGAGLSDPESLLEGTGARLRHVKVRSTDAVEPPAIRALIEAALKERRAALARRSRSDELETPVGIGLGRSYAGTGECHAHRDRHRFAT